MPASETVPTPKLTRPTRSTVENDAQPCFNCEKSWAFIGSNTGAAALVAASITSPTSPGRGGSGKGVGVVPGLAGGVCTVGAGLATGGVVGDGVFATAVGVVFWPAGACSAPRNAARRLAPSRRFESNISIR